MLRYLLIAVMLCLGGCALPKADPAREAQVDRVYEIVRRGDEAGLMAIGTPDMQAQDLDAAFAELPRHIYASTPTEAVTVQWAVQSQATAGSGSRSIYRLVRRYSHPEGDVNVDVTLVSQGDADWRVDGFWAARTTAEGTRQAQAQIDAARFTLAGKSPTHFLMLGGAILSTVLSLVSVIVAGFRRRWGWMFGNLFGFGQVAINWTTGALGFSPIYVSLLGAGIMKTMGPADPWILSVSLPLPAILFWALGKWRKKTPKTKPPKVDPDAVAYDPDSPS